MLRPLRRRAADARRPLRAARRRHGGWACARCSAATARSSRRRSRRRMKEAGLARAGISLDSVDADYHNAAARLAYRLAGGDRRDARLSRGGAALPGQHHRHSAEPGPGAAPSPTSPSSWARPATTSSSSSPRAAARTSPRTWSRRARYEQLLEALMRKQQEIEIEIKPTCAPQFVRIADTAGPQDALLHGLPRRAHLLRHHPDRRSAPLPLSPRSRRAIVHEQPFSRDLAGVAGAPHLARGDSSRACAVTAAGAQRCFGCRARAYWATGNLMAEDPWCALVVRRNEASTRETGRD